MYEFTIKQTKKLETLLEEELKASGKGLHEKLTSVDTILSNTLVKDMRAVASIRNKLMHEDGYEISDPENFKRLCEKVNTRLTEEIAAYKEEQRIKRLRQRSQQNNTSNTAAAYHDTPSVFYKYAFWPLLLATVVLFIAFSQRDEKLRTIDNEIYSETQKRRKLESQLSSAQRDLKEKNKEIKALKKDLKRQEVIARNASKAFNEKKVFKPIVANGLDKKQIEAEKKYLQDLAGFILLVDDSSFVSKQNDSFNGITKYEPRFSWSIEKSDVSKLIPNAVVREPRKTWRRNGFRAYHKGLRSRDEFDSIAQKYALYRVMEVGSDKFVSPIVSPVRTRKGDFNGSPRSDEICRIGRGMTDIKANNTYLCVALSIRSEYRGYYSIAYRTLPEIKKRNYNNFEGYLTLPSTKAVEIKHYFEIKNLKTGKVVYRS